MSIYCVSDLHGQDDLFTEGLKKIKFDFKKDKLYILGDVCNHGKGSLKLYDLIFKNRNSLILLKGNHEINFLQITKIFIEVIKHKDLLEAYSMFLKNYVTGTSKVLHSEKKLNKWQTTERRQLTIKGYQDFKRLAELYNIDWWWLLTDELESSFKNKNTLMELINNVDYDYNTLIKNIEECDLVTTLQLSNGTFYLYHSQYSDINNKDRFYLSYQLISRLNNYKESTNNYYIYGHTPIPKVYSRFSGDLFNYNEIFKAIDINNNKYYDIDVSHYGICFLNLQTLEETYVGKYNEKKDTHEKIEYNEYSIEKLFDEDTERYLIKKSGYNYCLAIYNRRDIKYYSICELFDCNDHTFSFKFDHKPKIDEILNTFLLLTKK